MNKTFNEVKQAVQRALSHTSFNHEITDPKAFYIMTMENGLSGLVFSVLDESKTHPELYHRLKRNYYDYIARDIKQIETIQFLDERLNAGEIDHLFLKGSILKTIYPETYMRAMGDIDILIHENDLYKVHKLFSEHHIKCTSKSVQHDVFEMKNGIVIEVHPILYKEFNDHYQFIGEVWNHVHLEEKYRFRMNPEFELIYLMYHLAKHIESGGIGLRSVLDIGIYLQAYEEKLNLELLKQFITQMHMETFFDVILDFVIKTFGFEYQFIKPQKRLNEEDYNYFVKYLTISGIHGIGRDYNVMQARTVSYAKNKKSKLRLIFDIFFPKLDIMMGIYPWLRKAKMLLPFAWIIRWIHIMIKRPKKSVKKLAQLNISQEEIKRQKEFLETIGL
jgi:hypothetical protein